MPHEPKTNVYTVTFNASSTTQVTTSTTEFSPIRGKRLLGFSVAMGSRPLFVRVSYRHAKDTNVFGGVRLKSGWVRIGDNGAGGSDGLSWQGDIPTEPDDTLEFYVENAVEADQTVRAQVLVEE
jgi:hypothetical protein